MGYISIYTILKEGSDFLRKLVIRGSYMFGNETES